MIKFEKPEMITAENVLKNVEEHIANYSHALGMREVCDDLSIFDWWPKTLNLSHLEQMRAFLKEAIKLGYKGYCCFKVGMTGCANGMWANKELSTDGHSPDGPVIYHSFTPAYTYWSVNCDGKRWFPEHDHYDMLETTYGLEKYIAEKGLQLK